MSGRFAALALVALAGCSTTIPVKVEYDPSASFSTYRTYDWLPTAKESPVVPEGLTEMVDWRIRTAVENQLAAKGYIKRPGGANFLIGYRIRVRETTVKTFQDYYWYRQTGGSDSPQDAYVIGYREGTLFLDIVDPASKRMIWRAYAKAAVNPNQPENQGERVNQAVREMLAQFPPH